MPKVIAGIGSRKTPKDILVLMRRIGAIAMMDGYSLRSGGADGADKAFETGARFALDVMDIRPDLATTANISVYLPWRGFNDYAIDTISRVVTHPGTDPMVDTYHPAAAKLSRGPRSLMRRNCHQVLGDDLNDPSSFVVCWTPEGAVLTSEVKPTTGGTGFAIRLANAYNIPVFNLQREDHRSRICSWVDSAQTALEERGVILSFSQ